MDLGLGKTVVDRQVAKDLCTAQGGMLPEPRNQQENDFLNSMETEAFFLGTTDLAVEGRWVWDSDGSVLTWTFWKTAEPDAGTKQNCAIMLRNNNAQYEEQWASEWCYLEKRPKAVVCERKCK